MSELLEGLRASSASAAVMILTALLLRAVFQCRTPRRVFCLLWDMALVRLLILAALPSPMSIWQWVSAPVPKQAVSRAVTPGAVAFAGHMVTEGSAAIPDAVTQSPVLLPDRNAVLGAVWLAAALALAAWFLWSHLRFRRISADSLPCEDAFVRDWLTAHPLRRRVQVRTSDRIASPLTYGVFCPAVLLPSGMEWPDQAALSCVLEHEFQHIRRFDTLRRTFLAFALCLHWFNPLVWVLFILSSRDMELACDEAVTERGADRAGYAQTLLNMEEHRSQWALSGSHFSQNALKERIRAIMNQKKTSITALITVLLIMSTAAVVFASAAPERKAETPSGQSVPKTGYVYDHSQAVEGEVMILSQGGENGEKQYSVDGGKTWLDEDRYHAEYGGWSDSWQVEWWAAEDYAVWLEEEKQALQSIIGERGYTGGEGWFTWDQKRVDETIALYESILKNIENGALYSKAIITDSNGTVMEGVALSSGTLGVTEIVTYDEENAVVSEAEDVSALLEEMKAFGVSGREDRMTYNGQRIRCLVDGAPVGSSGYSVRYVYTNPDGTVDVHTLRSVIRNPDGSYDPFGKLIGVAAKGEAGFDQNLIDSAIFSGSSAQATTEISTDTGKNMESALEPYTNFGLNYQCEWDQNEEMQLRMSWNGKSVHSLYDAERLVWFANNMYGTDLGSDAVDLETVYRNGKLYGLRECRPPHNEAAAAAAAGSGTEDGQPFEEIFARYQSYGLVYSPRERGMGSLTWNGQAVKSFADLKPDGGAFSYQDPYAEGGLRVYTEYDADGHLTGLRTE